ncbi:MAG: zf-HC2 domain-containing protein [Nocardioides marinisabuli]|uniref:anti-sigma factor family protein n=1 Tax=Nocardioides TaxID=1839 RepID=UPI0021C37285|nr:zf-HC2 domain-containing protein [Nocardioides sp. OK12]
MQGPRSMLECWWSGRVLDRYVEQQPAAPLGRAERERLERHLAVCGRCASSAAERRRVHAALDRLGAGHTPPPASLRRAHDVVRDLTHGDTR